jgi:hypothetical protein
MVERAARAAAVGPTGVGQVERDGPGRRAPKALKDFAGLQARCGSPTAPDSE